MQRATCFLIVSGTNVAERAAGDLQLFTKRGDRQTVTVERVELNNFPANRRRNCLTHNPIVSDTQHK